MSIKFILVPLLSSLALFASCATTVQKNPAQQKVKPPITILMVGDSMMGGFFGKALAEELQSRPGITVIRDYKISTGLSGLNPYDWQARTNELMALYNPDILIISFGANDSLAVKEKDGTETLYRNPNFRTRYVRHVHDFVKFFSPRLKRVYIIGQPATDHHQFGVRYPVLNDMFQETVSHFPKAVYVPAWKHTVNEKGFYAPYMKDKEGKMRKVKYDDQVHPTPAGGIIMKDALLPYFEAEIELLEAVQYTVNEAISDKVN